MSQTLVHDGSVPTQQPDVDDQIRELERELKVRSRVYPRLIALNQLSENLARKRTITMEAALETLRAVKRTAI